MVLRFSILAVAFLLSCTGIERDSVCDEKSIKYNGCVGGVSSSSSSGSSSNPSSGSGRGNDIANYKIVTIDDRVWMAQNLDYDVSGSVCYNDAEANCMTYGRLYDWATAMNLPPDCNSNYCVSQIKTKHQGICPEGWHIPSNDEWDKLISYAGGNETAGRYLKATRGWSSGGNGEDKYEFSALPGGLGTSDGYFSDVGIQGYWWSSSEFSNDNVWSWGMGYSSEPVVNYYYGGKSKRFSIRCLKD